MPQGNNNGYVYYPYAEATTARWAILIKVNGVVYDTLKLDCGNLVDSSRALPNPTTTIEGHVWNWTTNGSYAGMRIYTCISSQPYVYTNGNGDFYIRNVPIGTGFCVRVSASTPTDMTGPYVRPLGTGYGQYCPSFGNSRSSPLVNGKNYCTADPSYEFQYAGEYVGNGHDRNADGGYDLVFALIPPVPQCSFMNVSPGSIDPGTPYTINAGISYQDHTEASYVRSLGGKLFIDVTGPGVNYNNGNVGSSVNGSVISGTVNPGVTNNTGTYTVRYGISGALGPITCTGTFTVTDHPYSNTPGGSTGTGAGMTIGGVDCAVPADPKGGLVGWNKEAAGGYAGAGTQYAALALGHIQDFATAQDGPGGTSSNPSKLAFANTAAGDVNLSNGLFGGLYGGSACTHDYFAGATHVQNGDVTIGGQTIANGTSKAIYVKGNVYINGNITFSGTYANTGEIPSYDIIVEGNIYIAPNVSRLDGLYVAEPTSATNGGIIYTCAPAPFTAQALNQTLYANCHGNSLSVNGSLVARQVWLLRANGSISSNPAEMVTFTPEVWLATPPDTVSGSGAASDTYDAITSLPPVL